MSANHSLLIFSKDTCATTPTLSACSLQPEIFNSTTEGYFLLSHEWVEIEKSYLLKATSQGEEALLVQFGDWKFKQARLTTWWNMSLKTGMLALGVLEDED